MSNIHEHLELLKQEIEQISPSAAAELIHDPNCMIIDIREQEELNSGTIPNAVHIARGFLELKIEGIASDKKQLLITYCASGVRSLLAARDLRNLGYTRVASLQGGFNQWKAMALPIETVKRLNTQQRERYLRHLSLPEFGEEGQLKLLDSKVLIVGAGGLGSPTALYLAAAGVGEIGIIDSDLVERSNLQRQILHRESTIGQPKVESAKTMLKELNPEITINCYQDRLRAENALDLFAKYDLVIDGTDNFAARYLINDACVKLGKPNVHGSIYRFTGQVSVFWPAATSHRGPCYRCLFPEPPPPEQAPSCAEAGVLGVLPGIIGVLEAVEALKILAGIGQTLVGRLLSYDALAAKFMELKIPADPDCKLCQMKQEDIILQDYSPSCRI